MLFGGKPHGTNILWEKQGYPKAEAYGLPTSFKVHTFLYINMYTLLG